MRSCTPIRHLEHKTCFRDTSKNKNRASQKDFDRVRMRAIFLFNFYVGMYVHSGMESYFDRRVCFSQHPTVVVVPHSYAVVVVVLPLLFLSPSLHTHTGSTPNYKVSGSANSFLCLKWLVFIFLFVVFDFDFRLLTLSCFRVSFTPYFLFNVLTRVRAGYIAK